MKWTENQVQELRWMAENGATNAAMAAHFGVPLTEIHAKRSQLGITIAKVRGTSGKATGIAIDPAFEAALEESPAPEAQGLDQKDLICLAQHFKAYFYQCCHEEIASWGKPCEDCPIEPACHGKWGNIERKLHDLTGLELKRVSRKRSFDTYLA